MPPLPTRFAPVILAFRPLFRQPTWRHARTLLIGALLAPGGRTVASALRILGLAGAPGFERYHRVLSRAAWSLLAGGRILLGLLVAAFARTGALVVGLDDTLERRRGAQIAAAGSFRDPVRSSTTRVVTAWGLRWLSVMLLVEIPWAGCVWALPVLTALAPNAHSAAAAGRRHKPLTTWARQLMRQLARWCRTLAPGRRLILVADQSFAALELLAALAPAMACLTRLRLDARLFAPAPVLAPGARRPRGRPRKAGARLPTLTAVLADPATAWTRLTLAGWYGGGPRALDLATGTAVWYQTGKDKPVLPVRWVLVRDPARPDAAQALLSTDLTLSAAEIVGYYVRRWRVEVTFAEARRHLGVETQRQWSARAVARTTPLLFGLVSLVTLLADTLVRGGRLPVRTAAWYPKRAPTFSDALAAVRRPWWGLAGNSRRSARAPTPGKIPRTLLRRLTEAVCYAA